MGSASEPGTKITSINAKVLFGLDETGNSTKNLRTPGTVRKFPAGVQAKDDPDTTPDLGLSRLAEVVQTVHGIVAERGARGSGSQKNNRLPRQKAREEEQPKLRSPQRPSRARQRQYASCAAAWQRPGRERSKQPCHPHRRNPCPCLPPCRDQHPSSWLEEEADQG